MRMDLIQPFIGSLDAVLAEMMKVPAKIVDLTMEEEGYRRRGTAAAVRFKGQIEGRVILDMEPGAAAEVLTQEQCEKAGQDSEATILCFETPGGNVHLNIAMQYLQRRTGERTPVAVH